MIDILVKIYEDDTWEINSISPNIDDDLEKERIEKRLLECGICGSKGEGYPLTTTWIEQTAKLLGVDGRLINVKCESYGHDAEIRALGFTDADIEAVEKHFLCRIHFSDWKDMKLLKEIDEEEYEGAEDILKLPSGKWVEFGSDLLHSEDLAQMD